jgi:hypothetical protein
MRFVASKSSGEVGALLMLPEDATRLFVLAHGAGAGMRHAFMEAITARLAAHGVATFRYQFPYMEKKTGRPDPKPVLFATVRAALAAAAEAAPGLPILAGGKSMGGRMTSMAAAEEPLEGVGGIVFVGFPLHPAGAHSTERGDHLARVGVPMLFLQGTRDALADLDLLRPITAALGARATLHVIDGADHSFHVLKRSGRTDADVQDELASTVTAWGAALP